MTLTTALFILLFLGFANTLYLYWQYRQFEENGRQMYCFIGGDCQAVVTSKYGKFFGVKNEVLGILYYFLLALLFVVFINYPYLAHVSRLIILATTVVATLYSARLLLLQFFTLRKICSWCIIAIGLNFAIFGLAFSILV